VITDWLKRRKTMNLINISLLLTPLMLFLEPLFNFFSHVFANPETFLLPYFTFRTLLRMSIAYIFVLIFGIFYGILATLNEKTSQVLIPILDILQSIPVLGFFPIAILFFIYNFPGALGLELASILLIFTGMAWSVVFNVIAGIRAIPEEIKRVSKAYGIRGFAYVKEIIFPAIFPWLISGSILAWGGGWYFLIACEYITFSAQKYTLPGLGYYLANAAFNGDFYSAIFGLIIMVLIILTINRAIWGPLMSYAEKYKYESISSSTSPSIFEKVLIKRIKKYESKIVALLNSIVEHEKSYLTSLFRTIGIYPHDVKKLPHLSELIKKRPAWSRLVALTIIFSLIIVILLNVFKAPIDFFKFLEDFSNYPEVFNLPYYTFRSMLRLFFAYGIALSWTLPIGIITARSNKLSKILIPIFDVGQSIPAMALFPFIVIFLVVYFQGSWIGQELASILLLLTGMQWYLLFNIVGATKSIPADIIEVAKAYGIKGARFFKEIMIPSILPALLIGSIQAWGGGWNALIVSEYINYGEHVYKLPGLGYFLDKAAWEWGSTSMIVLSLMTMVLIILLMNRLIWRKLMLKVEKYKFEV
jgi:NitT/TauT family transport system permease protein